MPRHRRLISRVLLATLLWFTVCLVPGRAAPAEQDVWTGVARTVAVGDVHGDYDKFVAVLRLAGELIATGVVMVTGRAPATFAH